MRYGLSLCLPLFLAACSCPTNFRDVPEPRLHSTAQVDDVSRCQIEHYGTTLLGQADSAAISRALLERGALPQGNLIIKGQSYRGTALWLATAPDVIQTLIAAKADPNRESGPDRETPLCAAIRQGQVEKARLLLQGGADPNRFDSDGVTPLGLAASRLDATLCQLLLSKGAQPDSGRLADGSSPLMLALRQGNSPEASATAKCSLARLLLAHGASPTIADAEGDTPLHYAPAALVAELLAGGADANARNNQGRTPLFQGGSPQRVDALLQSGADINARDYHGNTPFDAIPDAQIKSYLLVKGGRSGQAL